jgi:hypothetical protein
MLCRADIFQSCQAGSRSTDRTPLSLHRQCAAAARWQLAVPACEHSLAQPWTADALITTAAVIQQLLCMCSAALPRHDPVTMCATPPKLCCGGQQLSTCIVSATAPTSNNSGPSKHCIVCMWHVHGTTKPQKWCIVHQTATALLAWLMLARGAHQLYIVGHGLPAALSEAPSHKRNGSCQALLNSVRLGLHATLYTPTYA